MFNSIYQIFVKKSTPHYDMPWTAPRNHDITGSAVAVLVEGKKYILTNYHCVENGYFIQARRQDKSTLFQLEIKDIAPHIDLALLTAPDDFWEDIQPLPWGRSPKRGEKIRVIGYPFGGINYSVTQGVVSRLADVLYGDAVQNIALQVDAAINPGNSGGGAIDDKNRLVGIAFSHNRNAQNVCYIIPTLIVNKYLQDFKRCGKFPGICDLDIKTQPVEGVAEKYFGQSGIMVNKISPQSTAAAILRSGDIIYEIGGIVIHGNKTVYLDHKYNMAQNKHDYLEAAPYWHVLRMYSPGDKLSFKYLRNGAHYAEQITLTAAQRPLVPSLVPDINMTYYIAGGIIFMVLNSRMLLNGNKPTNDRQHFMKYLYKFPTNAGQEIVILHHIIATAYTAGYNIKNSRLKKINGKNILCLQEVYEICENIGESDNINFTFSHGIRIILPAAALRESNNIAQRHLGIKYTNLKK